VIRGLLCSIFVFEAGIFGEGEVGFARTEVSLMFESLFPWKGFH
jgi:hypothetical protein